MLSRFLKSILALLLTVNAAMSAQKDSQSQKQELEQLLSAAMPFAEQMLKKYGEFYPYGATMDGQGKITQVGGHTGIEHPKSTELIELLFATTLRQARSRPALSYTI